MPPFKRKGVPLDTKPPGQIDIVSDIDTTNKAQSVVENKKFAFTPDQLSKLINPKSLAAFHALGGLSGLEKGLRTDIGSGILHDETSLAGTVRSQGATRNLQNDSNVYDPSLGENGASLSDRKRIFGHNALPDKTSRLPALSWPALHIITGLLLLAFAVSVATWRLDWLMMVGCMALALRDAVRRREIEHRFRQSHMREVKVSRSSRPTTLPICDIVVGDVVLIEPGDLVPADGILMDGYGIKCKEFITPQLVRKRPAGVVWEAIANGASLYTLDPFILSGSQVYEGVGSFLVTRISPHSVFGKRFIDENPNHNQHWTEQQPSTIGWWCGFMTSLVNTDYGLILYAAAHLFIKETLRAIIALVRNLGQPLLALVSFLILQSSRPPLGRDARWKRGATLPLVINGSSVHAIPDTGADENVISIKCASALNLCIEVDRDPAIFKLANGRCVKSCGIVRTPLAFARGTSKHQIKEVLFKVFPALAVPMIMGRKFLKDTQTLSKYDDRLHRPSSHFPHSVPRVLHLSAPKQRLRCYLNGFPVYANADTGAEMNLASPQWAAKHKVAVEKPAPGHDRVMLADGSIARITGQFSAKFCVSHKAFTKQFFILDGLTSDVLLCQELLLDIRAFKEQKKAFIELDSPDTFADLNLVSWLSKREKKFLKLFRKDTPKPSLPPDPVSFQDQLHLKAAREQDRHAQAVREISRLPEAERRNRMLAETKIHEAFHKSYTATMVRHQNLSPGPGASSPGLAEMNNST
ncbi:hypothetical protein BJX76DRAFT_360614 [Aspergillus varians]